MGKLKKNGFKDFEKKLKQMKKAAKELEGPNSVPFSELFTDSFLKKYTNFSSFNDFKNQEIFTKYPTLEDIPNDEMDEFVSSNTKFDNWDDMLGTAGTEYAARKLGF